MSEELPDVDVRPGAKRLVDALVQAGAWPPTDRASRRRLARLVRKAEKRQPHGVRAHPSDEVTR